MGFLTALRFLTIIPMPGRHDAAGGFGSSLAFFPLIGLMVGVVLFGLYTCLGYFMPAPVDVVLVIIALSVLTGGHHLDGLMDTFDGMVSSKTRQERLVIMADHHVGAFGAIALVLLLLLKFSTLYSTPQVMQSLLLMPVMSRWLMVNAIFIFPYAKQTGMGYTFKQQARWPGLLIATVIALITAGILLGWRVIPVTVILWLLVMAFAAFLRSRFGGLTGDNYGAVNEIAEAVTVILIGAFHGG